MSREPYTGIDGSPQPAIRRDLRLGRARAGAFVTATLRPTARLTVSPGLRVDYSGLAQATYAQPRLALSYRLTDRLTANAAGGLYRQAVPLWLAAQSDENRGLADPQALHAVGGVDYQLAPEVLVTVEGFWKGYSDTPESTPGSPFQVPAYALDARGEFSGAAPEHGRGRGIRRRVCSRKSWRAGSTDSSAPRTCAPATRISPARGAAAASTRAGSSPSSADGSRTRSGSCRRGGATSVGARPRPSMPPAAPRRARRSATSRASMRSAFRPITACSSGATAAGRCGAPKWSPL